MQEPLGRAAVLAGAILAISVLHYVTAASQVQWQSIIPRLFYLPVVFAALYFGWRGGLAAALLAGVSYFPHMADRKIQYAEEVVLFCFVGVLTGILADRERKQKRALQQAAEQLTKVYGELQDNFERMKRAERLYALGQLSAGLAHEIRNPLASIEGAAAILQRDSGSEERRSEFLEIIQKECRRLNRLLTSFLEFAKPRVPEYQRVEVGQVFDSVIALAEHAIRRHEITLRKEIASGLPEIECDPEHLTQVLLNLTINAIQAMPEGGEILLSAHRQNMTAVIEVRDQGAGISQEDLERIFDPFFTTKESGTGLGLPVAYQITAKQGGILTAKRNSDQGMTFALQLPLHYGRAS